MGIFAGCNILVADQSPELRAELRAFLEANAFVVCEASNGQEAIEVFDRESPKLVLMDSDMAVGEGSTVTGLDACKRIREIDRDEYSPVLFMTNHDDEAFIEAAFTAGAADFVTRPINQTLLKHRILYELKVSRSAYALQDSEERYRQIFEALPLPYQSLNRDGCIIDINKAGLDMLGYEAEEVLGRSFGDFLPAEDWRQFLDVFPQFVKTGQLPDFQLHMLNKQQQAIVVELNGRISVDLSGEFKQTHSIMQNITERKATENKLKMLATTDPLTGLGNRRAFFEQSGRDCRRCIRYQHPFSCMMLDIDHFKSINDTFGHDVGDEVLKMVADIMKKSLRDVDVLGRLGGEEFAVAMPETDLNGAAVIAERIRLAIDLFQLDTDAGVIDTKISIGVTTLGGDIRSVEAMLKQADTLLYKAKQNGRNRVELVEIEPA